MSEEKPLVNRKRGEFAAQLDGKWIVLRANFANISQFEETTGMGIYQLANKVSMGDIRMTDVVNVYYIFMDGDLRKTYNRDDIALSLMNSDPEVAVTTVANFLSVMFNIDDKTMGAAIEDAKNQEDKKK